MPAATRLRQASVADWFATEQGQRLECLQLQAVAERLPERPSQPLLWLGPGPDWPRTRPHIGAAAAPRVLCLHDTASGWQGDLHGQLPLPLANASFGTIVLQHPRRDACVVLLEEVRRLLLPGGVVWLFAAHPAHPARLLHPTHPLWDAPPGGWRAGLQAAGLQLRRIDRIGAAGLALESASILLEAEKRSPAIPGLRPIRPWVSQLASRTTCTKVT